MVKVLIPFYSLYGHVHQLAVAIAAGASKVPGVTAEIKRGPETLTDEVLAKMGAAEAQKQMSSIPICCVADLEQADAIIFGTPTRFGNMCGQMRQFLDATGGLWAKGALVGKVGGVFTCTGSQHGGQETTLLTFMTNLLHHGMVVVGLPYSFTGQTTMDEIAGGSPYGATTIAGPKGLRQPSPIDLEGARFQGTHTATIASRLFSK